MNLQVVKAATVLWCINKEDAETRTGWEEKLKFSLCTEVGYVPLATPGIRTYQELPPK